MKKKISKISRKILNQLLYLLLIAVLITSMYGIIVVQKDEINRYRSIARQELEQSKTRVEKLFNRINNDIEMFAKNPLIKNKYKEITSYVSTTETTFMKPSQSFGSEKEIYELFRYYGESHPEVLYVYFGTIDGGYVQWPETITKAGYDPRKRPWYQKALENPGKLVTTEPYYDGIQGYVFSNVKTVYDDEKNIIGVLGIDLKSDFVSKILREDVVSENLEFLIITTGGIVLASTFDEKQVFKLVKELGFENIEEFLKLEKSSFLLRKGNQRFIAEKMIVKDRNFVFVVLTPLSTIHSLVVNHIIEHTVPLIIFFILLIIALYLQVNKMVINPIEKLSETISIEKFEDLSTVDFKDTKDEISLLYRKYNELVKTLQDSYAQLQASYEEITAQNQELEAQYEIIRDEEEKISELYLKMRTLFENSPDGIVEFDSEHRVTDVNESFVKIFGYTKEECLGKNLDDIVVPKKFREEANEVTNSLFSKGQVFTEGIRYRKDGKPVYVLIRGVLIKKDGEPIGGFGIYTDLTEIKEYEQRIEYLNIHDTLTGLYNQSYFSDMLKKYSISDEYHVGIVLVDIDGMQVINQTSGRETGDKIISDLAKILETSFRTTDVVARIGGDEFGIILPKTDSEAVENILKRIEEKVAKYNQENADKGYVLSITFGYSFAYEKADLNEVFKIAQEDLSKRKLLKHQSAKSQTLNVLLTALAEKDDITKGHTDRVAQLCQRVAEELMLSKDKITNLLLLAEVHDLGKIGIPDKILFKPGKLNDEEWEIMKKHTEIGYRIAKSSPDLSSVAELILKHHERWDGKGYPLRLKGEEIPIECRILSVVDSFDAMTNQRPYNVPKTIDEAVEEIKRCSGSQFDPKVVEAFVKVIQNCEIIKKKP